MGKVRIEEINAVAELDRLGVKFQLAGTTEVRVCCPVHEDSTPSVSLNVERNVWICQSASCEAKGDVVSLLALLAGVERHTMIVDLSTRYDLEELKTIHPETVEKFHQNINEAGPLLQALRVRGITDEMIKYAQIGFFKDRITIPVKDEYRARVLNIRRYLPGAPGPQKMRNTRGYGDPRIYQGEHLKYDTIWITGGELKALAAGWYLKEKDIGAIAVTAGEGAWEAEWNKKFKGKTVYICMDVDEGGRKAARKIAMQVATTADKVYIIQLPLDIEKYPKGDINDYIGKEKASVEDLLKCMEDAKEFSELLESKTSDSIPTEIVDVHLSEANNPRYIHNRVHFNAIVSAAERNPFIVPSHVGVNCTRDQPGCIDCSISGKPLDMDHPYVECEVPSLSPGILEMVDAPASVQRKALMRALDIHPSCKVVGFKLREHCKVHDVRLVPQLSIGNEESKDVIQPAYIVGTECELNSPYNFTGVLHPHPKTQQSVLLINESVESDDSLTSFKANKEDLKDLKVFQPKSWTDADLSDKMDEIYKDLSYNVTRIFKRDRIHLIVDLTYHSVLHFNFDNRIINGWVSTLLIGDSAQGKSETSTKLVEHYGVGVRVECKNATAAGLIGGLQQLGNKWFVSWGFLPRHDRRLVILEEIKGMSTETISKTTDMRSSGIAELPKIEHRRTNARTRTLWISNARSNRQIATYNFGVDAILELIGGLEDIRRFDCADVVSAEQIDPAEMTSLNREDVDHIHTSRLCRTLILWTWTRKTSQITFEEGIVEQILKESNRFCEKYSESFPLVDRGTMRFKLARLSIALAARTFSTEDGETILVRECHVNYIVKYLEGIYDDPIFGYQEYSVGHRFLESVRDQKNVKAYIKNVPHAEDFVDNLLHRDDITPFDIMDATGTDREHAHKILSFLVRKRALRREKSVYRKSSEFINMLKIMATEDFEQDKVVEEDAPF